MAISRDDDLAIRTIIGEAAGEDLRGQQAVAAVIQNRMKQSGMTPEQVVMAKNQFEPWRDGGKKLMSISPDDPRYQAASNAWMGIRDGSIQDPTNGATHFYAPKAQAALGRSAPKWDNGKGVDLGNHRFFNLGYNPGSSGGSNAHGIPTSASAYAPTEDQLPNGAMTQAYDETKNVNSLPEQSPIQKKTNGLFAEDWNLGDTLGYLSVALLARDNPQAAAAIASMFNNDGKNKTKDPKLINQNSVQETGEAIYEMPDGSFKRYNVGKPMKRITDTHRKTYNENDAAIRTNELMLSRLAEIQKDVDSGLVDVTWDSKAKEYVAKSLGSDSDAVAAADRVNRFLKETVNIDLRQNKGPQTDFDWKASFDAKAGGAAFNSRILSDVLYDAEDHIRNKQSSLIDSQYRTINTGYYDFDTSEDSKKYTEMKERYKSLSESIAERRKQYMNRRNSEQGTQPQPNRIRPPGSQPQGGVIRGSRPIGE